MSHLQRCRTGAIVFALGMCLSGVSFAGGPVYQVVAVHGEIEIGSGTPLSWRSAREGDELHPGEAIRVRAGSKAQLEHGGRTIRIYENSILRLPERRPRVKLERGVSLFDVVKSRDKTATPFEVETSEILASVKGTRFAVGLHEGPAAVVSVFEGTVSVRELLDPDGFPVVVRGGYAARMGGGLAPMLFFHDRSDPWEAWTSQSGPAPSFGPQDNTSRQRSRKALQNAADRELERQRRGGAERPRERSLPAAGELDRVQDIGDADALWRTPAPPPANGGGGGNPGGGSVNPPKPPPSAPPAPPPSFPGPGVDND